MKLTKEQEEALRELEDLGHQYRRSGEGVSINYSKLKTSGKKVTFASGAVRDSAEGKPRMELLPLDLLLRVAVLYGKGAEAYGDNNWRRGQKKSHVFGSLLRHLTAYAMGKKDEDHLAAVVWNALSLMNVDEYHSDKPEINDMADWFVNGLPTGKGAYRE